ncbi:hypothetical protein NM208_g14024 [Fusarium decemcellulare]|uniref:Uncharacterized protein n=1 Tax=Fusarium decemcellulare TaxID=57161 RepID=A0ACC1RLS6_9HYPO|nr:hypothetical protein NM208_g14024 [Fusarium decemcellulare]
MPIALPAELVKTSPHTGTLPCTSKTATPESSSLSHRYYLLYGENVTAFPPDFRMLSGSTNRRTYTAGDPSKPDPEKSTWNIMGEVDQDVLAQRALGFNCLNYQREPEGTLYRHYMPDKEYLDANCKDGIRLEIMFPSCWKGGDAVDSDNHKDHVAFPDLVMTGTCPSGYPVRIPSLMYEVIWNTDAFADRNGKFVFANEDTTGYGYHADFIMGWEEEFLQDAINTCTSETGKIEDCPLFDVISEGEATSCEMELPKVLAKEDVLGPMAKLPGGTGSSYGDGSDDGASQAPGSTAGAKPTLSYTPGDRPENSASPLPGQVFKETSAYEAPAPSLALPSSQTTLIQIAQSVPGVDGSVGAAAAEPTIAEAPTSIPTSAPATTPAPEPAPPTDTQRATGAPNTSPTATWETARAGGLGLGWILAFSVGGAILLFAAIGFLLSWRIKSRSRDSSSVVYEVANNTDERRQSILTNRLMKKKSNISKSASRLSLSLPPVLPPLPTYNSFTFFGGNGKRGRSSSWVEEDKFHGPKMTRRDSLFSRDSWLGRAPTLPSLMMEDDPEKGEPSEQPEQETQVPERPSLEILQRIKTAPELPTQEQEMQTSPVRASTRSRVRPSVTDSDLHDILRCTEQRLRDGLSQSPTKTPRVSPTKRTPQKIQSLRSASYRNSPVKTPRSQKTVSSQESTNTTGTVRMTRVTQSPSKKPAVQATPTKGHTRNLSISSLGSAANSLLAEATQELGLAGGLSSPSRFKGHQWGLLDHQTPRKAESPQKIQSPQKIPSPQKLPTPQKQKPDRQSPDRRDSQESQASSSLSTLYSANEPEEKEQSDPFVEKKLPVAPSLESRTSLFGPRALKSRARNLSISIPPNQSIFNMPAQSRKPNPLPNLVSTQAVGGPPLSIVLQPPREYLHRDWSFNSRDRDGIALAFPVSTSMTSVVTPSVTTVTDEDRADAASASGQEQCRNRHFTQSINHGLVAFRRTGHALSADEYSCAAEKSPARSAKAHCPRRAGLHAGTNAEAGLFTATASDVYYTTKELSLWLGTRSRRPGCSFYGLAAPPFIVAVFERTSFYATTSDGKHGLARQLDPGVEEDE